jgi:4-aminobutyrate aminotransferase-like enzyme
MSREYELVPKAVPRVQTPFRRIVTELPAPESIPILETLQRWEPQSMRGQPPIVWDHAEGFQVYDAYGNCWIDWSSGVLIANAGHGRQEIIDAVAGHANAATDQLLLSSCSSRPPGGAAGRASPEPLKAFLLTTGSETVECAIKLCCSHGVKRGRSNTSSSPLKARFTAARLAHSRRAASRPSRNGL